MVSIGSTLGGMFSFSGTAGLIGTIFLILLITLIFFGGLCGGIIYYIYTRTWTEKAEIYKAIGGKLVRVRIDKAKYRRLGRVGDSVFFIGGKTKRHVGNPTEMIASHTWMFFERKDKELINFGLNDLDAVLKRAGVHFLMEDVRMQRLGIEKNLGDAFKKQSFWDKHGATIMNAIYILIVTISLIVLFSKLVDVSSALEKTANAITEMADAITGTTSTRPEDSGTGLISALIPLIMFKPRRKNGRRISS